MPNGATKKPQSVAALRLLRDKRRDILLVFIKAWIYPRAGWWRGEPRRGTMGGMNTSVQEAGGAMPEAIVYMPKGERRIFATVNGKAGWSPLKVDREAAEVLQRDLETIQAEVAAGKRSRPVLYFDHKTGPAAGLPKRFSWDDEKGVLLELDWTGAGKDAVLNQNYGYFSPTFRVGLETGEVLGLHRDATEVGSLVNRPAIEDIGQIAAAMPEGCGFLQADELAVNVTAANAGEDLSPRGGVAEGEKKPDNGDTAKGGGFTTMDEELKKRLGCDEKADDAAVTAAMIKCMDERDELQKMLDELKGEKDKVDAELKAAKAEAADAFVNDLKARNVIAPHDEARIAAAKAVFEANPAQARALFDGVALTTSGSVTEGSILASKPEGAGNGETEDVADGCQRRISQLMGFNK